VNRREIIEQFLPTSPLVAHLGMRLQSIGTDEATLVLPFRPELATMEDIVHGGAIASLIDTAGMTAGWADDAVPESLNGSTVSLNVSYLTAARVPISPRTRSSPAAGAASSSARSASPNRPGGSSRQARSCSGWGRSG
jgi:uncharacterized protein (TIGR00369 family)